MKPSPGFYRVIVTAILVFVALVVFASALKAQQYTLPCIAYTVAGQQFCETYYSNPAIERQPQDLDPNTVVIMSAFGWLVVNTTTGQSQYRGYATPEVANRSTDACPFPQVIDRHQGVQGWRVAGGNFIVAGNYSGSPTCSIIQVMTRVSPTSLSFNFIGDYNISNSQGSAIVTSQVTSSKVGIVMPEAFWPFGTTGTQWARINIGVGVFAVGNAWAGPQPQNTWEVVDAPVTMALSAAHVGKQQRVVDAQGNLTAATQAAAQFILRRKGGVPTPTFTPTVLVPTATPTRTPTGGPCPPVPQIICVPQTVTPTPTL